MFVCLVIKAILGLDKNIITNYVKALKRSIYEK